MTHRSQQMQHFSEKLQHFRLLKRYPKTESQRNQTAIRKLLLSYTALMKFNRLYPFIEINFKDKGENKMGIFKNWTRFEIGWLLTFTLVNIYLFFAWEDALIGLISSISGMVCVVLVAKGKIANYYFGIVQTLTYAYIAYGYSLYGEVMLNALFYFPVQFIGIYLWKRNKTVQAVFLWITALVTQGGNDFSMLVMWSAFLVNSIYGYINWRKLYSKQIKEAA